MLAFIRGPETFVGPGQIYVKFLPDGEPVQLTRDNFSKMNPMFSPDGSRIAYTVNQALQWDTWVVPVLNGQARRWLENASGLAWLDNHTLLFSEVKKDIHMGIVMAEDTRAGARGQCHDRPDHLALQHPGKAWWWRYGCGLPSQGPRESRAAASDRTT